jgi:hypothetical protein
MSKVATKSQKNVARNERNTPVSWLNTYRKHSAVVLQALEIEREAEAKAIAEKEVLDLEILLNEAEPAQHIDHSTQAASWSEPEAETVIENKGFQEIVAALDPENVMTMAHSIAKQIDERVEFQRVKAPDGNASIERTLLAARKELATLRGAKVLMASNVTPDFINRTLHDGSRYNVYAFGKLADIARSLIEGVTLSNAINNAVVKSLFRCKKAGVGFTLEIAKAAASDKIRIDPTLSKHLIRHTVSASTAPTQASSTMQALETLGVVRIDGSRRSPTYSVTNSPIAQALETMFSA